MKKGFSGGMKGSRTSAQVMEALDLMAVGDVRKKIALMTTPSLATTMLKSRARRAGAGAKVVSIKLLNDSGYMPATLTHVFPGGDE